MALVQALALALIALIILPGFSFYFDVVPKVTVLLCAAALVVVLAARRRDLARGPKTLGLLLLLNGVSLSLSTAFSTHRALSLYGTTWRSLGAAVQVAAMLFAWLLARHCAGRSDRARTVLRGIAFASLAGAAYGIAQYFGWDPLIPRASYRVGEGVLAIVRPPGTLGYGSYFATWLLMAVFLSLELARMEKARGWRMAACAAAALSLVAMALTGTRAALLGLAAGAIVWLWWSGFRMSRRALTAAGALILCGAAFYFSPAGQELRSRSRWFQEDPWGGARPLLWRDTLSMAVQRPLAGYGPETFLTDFPHYESKALSQAYPDFVHESPHNILLDALVSQGIPGILLLAALCVAGLSAAWKLKAGWLGAALAAGIVSQQFTAFTLPTMVLLLCAIALAGALGESDLEPRRSPVFAALAPLLVVALIYLAIRMTMADHALAETRRLLAVPDLKAATAEYETYWFWRLPGASADVWYARSWLELARSTPDPRISEQAIQIAEQAAARGTESAEEPFAAWYTLAQVASLHEDFLGTERGLRQAMTAHPTWFKPHWMLAQQLRIAGRLDDAAKEAEVAAKLDNGHHPEVAETLAEIRALQAK